MFKKKGETFSKHKVIIVRDDVMYVEKVRSADSDVIETETAIYKTEDATRYYNETEGSITYVFNVDIPAKVEAENLKLLRRATTIKNIFKYDTDNPFDINKMIPWIIVALALIFK